MNKFKINYDLLPMKAHYFLYNAGSGPVWAYMIPFAKQLGFSSFTVGTMYTFLPTLGVFVKPTMGAIADRFQCKKFLFMFFIVLTFLAFSGIPWIPGLPSSSTAEIHCDADTVLKVCSEVENKCYARKIIAEPHPEPTIICDMLCLANASFLQPLCKNWGLDCTNLTDVISLPNYNVTEVNLSAKINLQRTIQDGKCAFIRMSEVQFGDNEKWNVPYCDSLSKAECSISCPSRVITELVTSAKVDNSEVTGLYQFWVLFLFLALCYIGMAVVVSLGDAICFGLLGDRPSDYGYQRLWASVGWGLFSIIIGLILDQVSKGQTTTNYKPAFYMMMVLLTLDFLITSRIKYQQTKHSPSIVRDVGKLLSEARILVFVLWVINCGIYQALSWNFLFWYLEDIATAYDCSSQDWMKTLEGLVMAVQCFMGELPCFFFSGWILKKMGHIHMMSIVLLSVGLRFVLYSLLVNPWWVLPIEVLNGFTFGMFYSSMTSYAAIISPPGTEATMQGLAGGLFEGVGVSLGSFLAGLAFNSLPGWAVFLIFGVSALFSCFIHALVQYMISKRCAPILLHDEDYNRARYASPNDAIHMLEERPSLVLS